MAPKVNCNPQKLASIVTYLQKSRVAHNIKDLEKNLPAVASINGMQVKDYLQALLDENKINIEKIGSGNWYWSFASQDKKNREKALEDARVAHDKAKAVIEDLKTKLTEAQANLAEEEDMLDGIGESREDLVGMKNELDSQLNILKKELASYSHNDPTEHDRKLKEIEAYKRDAMQYTDEIYSMESWFKNVLGMCEEDLKGLRMQIYGSELDEEDCVLQELV